MSKGHCLEEGMEKGLLGEQERENATPRGLLTGLLYFKVYNKAIPATLLLFCDTQSPFFFPSFPFFIWELQLLLAKTPLTPFAIPPETSF